MLDLFPFLVINQNELIMDITARRRKREKERKKQNKNQIKLLDFYQKNILYSEKCLYSSIVKVGIHYSTAIL